MTKSNIINKRNNRYIKKRSKNLGKKSLALILATAMIMWNGFSPILAQEYEEDKYKLVLNSKEGCVLISEQKIVSAGEIVTIKVEFESTFNFEGVELIGQSTGEHIEYSNTDEYMSFEMPNESVSATPVGFNISSEINIKEVHKSNERRENGLSLEEYVISNANLDYIKEVNDVADVAGFLSTMQTMAKVDDFPSLVTEYTIDNLFSKTDINGTPLVKTMIDNTILFDLGDQNEYYIGYVDVAHFSEGIEMVDIVFGKSNTMGELIKDCIYDQETGLAYIPKSTYIGLEKESEEYVRVQALYLYEDTNITIPVEIRNNVQGEGIKSSGYSVLSIDDYTTTIQIAENGHKLNGKVFVAINGIPVHTDGYKYDDNTGALIIDTPSLSITSITVLIDQEVSSISTVLGSDWKTIQDISVEFSKKPSVGELFNLLDQRLAYYSEGVNEYSLQNFGYTYQPINSGGTVA